MYMHRQNCSVGQYGAIQYTQNMRVEWKVVTDNPLVLRKLKEFATPAQSLCFRLRWR